METLFSTVAQISFTVVGLFFVALTVDSDSRNYWFSERTRSRYVAINFLIMLLPGFVSIGLLIPYTLASLPAWLFIALILFAAYFYLYGELVAIIKSPAYKQIADYESILEVKDVMRFDVASLLVLMIINVYAVFVDQSLSNLLNFAIGFYLFLLILSSVVPAYVFLHKGIANKYKNELLNSVVGSNTLSKPTTQNSSTGIFYLLVLLTTLVSFLIGRFLTKD